MNSLSSTLSSEHSWMTKGPTSRRSSMESVLSIQSKVTEIVRDTSDTDWSSDPDFEYEPVTDPDDDDPPPKAGDTSSDNEIIATKVVAVSVCDDGDLEFADSEQETSRDDGLDEVDSEIDRRDYWRCVQCDSANNNPLYRYCEKCFKVRKSLFPPRPKRKSKRTATIVGAKPFQRVHLVGDNLDSGVDSNFNSQELIQGILNSQELSQGILNSQELSQGVLTPSTVEHSQTNEAGPSSQNDSETRISSLENVKENNILGVTCSRKRRAHSVDRTNNKRVKIDYSHSEHDSGSDHSAIESVDLPSVTTDCAVKVTKKTIVNTLKENVTEGQCIVCLTEPKSGVFVHGRIAHICCCYKCAVKVWTKLKRCPVCNSKVSNVLRAIVM